MHDLYSQRKIQPLSGTIKNYDKEPLFLFKCYGDSLILVDSIRAVSEGTFRFDKFASIKNFEDVFNHDAIFKMALNNGQYFYLIFNKKQQEKEWGGEIYTVYENSLYNNIATDSLRLINTNIDEKYNNEKFIEFQKLLSKINVAENYLFPYLMNYPINDSFHKQIEQEYTSRYTEMSLFVNQLMKEKPEYLITKIALAYYYPVLTDWQEETPYRDSIYALHFFDYFNPADSFFIHSNILPEKIDMYINFCVNKRDENGNFSFHNDEFLKGAIVNFLDKVENAPVPNEETFNFCLNYIVFQLEMKQLNKILFFLRDKYPLYFKSRKR